MDNVLLLRSPNGDGSDKYESAFQEAGYRTISVPVLETVLVNLEDLKSLIQTGAEGQNLSGVIITSARSCGAWREAVQGVVRQASTAGV